jgi:Zn-dependent protease
MPPAFLACPACGTLVHAAALKQTAGAADAAESAGDKRGALLKWREALALLPPGSKQHAAVSETIARLSREVDALPLGASGAPAAGTASRKRGPIWAALATVGALLAKFKFAIIFLLAKGKLLLTGIFQAKTFLSMAITIGVYTMAFGWKFAVGLIASIYVHEMGHVERLRHYGIPATAPMFIPGFGAFVRLRQHPATVVEDARVGLAGPLWGTAAALAFLLVGKLGGYKLALAIAGVGAWINLFNLTPIWTLDGGRAFNALSRKQRILTAVLLGVLFLVSHDGMLVLLALAAGWRASRDDGPEEGDQGTFLYYSGLALALVAIILAAGPLH